MEQWIWSCICAAGIPCLFMLSEGFMNPDQAQVFVISAVMEAGRSLVGAHTNCRMTSVLERHHDISLLHTIIHCWLPLHLRAVQVLCWISLPLKDFVKVTWVWIPELCSQSFLLQCVFKIQVNKEHLWEKHCKHQVSTRYFYSYMRSMYALS